MDRTLLRKIRFPAQLTGPQPPFALSKGPAESDETRLGVNQDLSQATQPQFACFRRELCDALVTKMRLEEQILNYDVFVRCLASRFEWQIRKSEEAMKALVATVSSLKSSLDEQRIQNHALEQRLRDFERRRETWDTAFNGPLDKVNGYSKGPLYSPGRPRSMQTDREELEACLDRQEQNDENLRDLLATRHQSSQDINRSFERQIRCTREQVKCLLSRVEAVETGLGHVQTRTERDGEVSRSTKDRLDSEQRRPEDHSGDGLEMGRENGRVRSGHVTGLSFPNR